MTQRRPGVVSVVLVNFRGVEDTLTSIDALRQVDWPEGLLEIIVVENGSGDDSYEILSERAAGVRLIRSAENLGFAGGSNLGARESHGEYIAFLNNDARPETAWIRAAVATFERDPRVGSVASKVLDWDGVNVDFTEAAMTWYGMGYKPFAGAKDDGRWETERDVLFGTGSALFIRAELFETLGGFDERYFMFYEDVDLGWRTNLLGHRVRYQPASIAYHRHHASMKKFGAYRETYLLERNALFTLYKNLGDDALRTALPAALTLAIRRGVARGDIDSTQLDIRRGGDETAAEMPVPKETMAGVFAIDQFVELLPSLTESRREIQASRTRSDGSLSALFGNRDEPAYPIERYLEGYDKITATLGGLELEGRRRILIVTGDPIGARMAGPAIRVYNMAKLLSREHDVRIVSTTKTASLDGDIQTATVSHKRPKEMVPHEEWADVLIVQGHALTLFPVLEKSTKIRVVDIYDPMHLEQLEQARGGSLASWNRQVIDASEALNHQLELGDFFLCASERQRHFWLGQLAAMGRVNAFNYQRDGDLSSLIDVVPFGLDEEAPEHTRDTLRGVVPGIGPDDKVVVWGGGLYNWFDPITLVQAVAQLAERRPNVRLFFMGVRHPNPNVPEMEIVSATRSEAELRGVANVNVFFNEDWVRYEDRQNYLLEADAGVSTHFQHIETTFSFRTRILDYLWAGLPIVTTDGDAFADLVSRKGLGVVVPERDADALADALERVLYDEEFAAEARRHVQLAREEFFWEKALSPLLEFCRDPQHAPDLVSAKPSKSKKSSRGGSAKVTVTKRPRPYGPLHLVRRTFYHLREGGPSAVAQKTREWGIARQRLREHD